MGRIAVVFSVIVRGARPCGTCPDAADRLADPFFVLDQRETHMVVSVLAEADAGRHRHAGFRQQLLWRTPASPWRRKAGIFAQMYIEAFGTSTIQPASCRAFGSTSRRVWYIARTSSTQA